MVFLAVSIILNLVLFGGFVGIGIGTVVTAIFNGPSISMFAHFLAAY